jgi:hypothetical protein
MTFLRSVPKLTCSWSERKTAPQALVHILMSCAHNFTLLVSSAGWKRSQCLSLIEWGRECILYWQYCSPWMTRFSYSLFNRWNMPCKLFVRVGRHKRWNCDRVSVCSIATVLVAVAISGVSHAFTKWWAGLSLNIWPLWRRPLSMTWSSWRPAPDIVSKSRRLSVVRAVGK